ncbi:MAG: hydroxyisourate hydrolase [Granulosicoccus sp.]|nr:hydroxyisourate hydrolase [Granulosicoccus sp.]
MGKLTTHVLDTSSGLPGRQIGVSLFRLTGDQRQPLITTQTNDDGRCDEPLLADGEFSAGQYELVFAIGEYFKRLGTSARSSTMPDLPFPDPPFLDDVVLRFGIAHPEQHYHVPLLVSPYGYSTYRGS